MESIKVTVYLPQELWSEVRKKAIDEGISYSELVGKALREYLEKEGNENDYF